MKWWHWLLISGVLIVVTGKVLARNVRNNNPLNIEYSEDNPWLGQIGHDGRFAKFRAADYGFRAGASIIRKYQRPVTLRGYGLKTLREIITRWAPPKENNTEAYIKFVSGKTGLKADAPIVLANNPELFARVLDAMSEMEGAEPGEYSMEDAKRGAMMS